MKNVRKKMVKTMKLWVFPPNHPILIGFSIINHPFLGYLYASIVSRILDTNVALMSRMSAASDATNREDKGEKTHTMQGMMDRKHYFTMSLT